MYNQNFESAKEKIILQAENKAYTYLLNKYAHVKIKSSDASLEVKEGPISGSTSVNGRIKCYASTPVLNHEIEVGMTVNNNDVSIEADETVADKVENALNSSSDYLPVEEVVTASLSDFRLIDSNEKYFKVAHPALEDAELGIVSKAEYAASPNKAELLKSIVSDSIARTASYNYKLEFTGSFVEPKIEKQADDEDYCPECQEKVTGGEMCSACKTELEHSAEASKKNASQNPEPKKSWLTADLEEQEVLCPNCGSYTYESDLVSVPDDLSGPYCPLCHPEAVRTGQPYFKENKTVEMSENMPQAKMADTLQQSMQAEQQKIAAEKDKLSNQAVNQLIPTLQGLGYGSAKVSEITPELTHSDNGFDGTITAMTFVDDKNSVKLVAFPIKIKASQVELPKLPLVKELISKAIDINEKLTEQLTKEALLKIAEVDEKVTYEKNEVEAVLKNDNKIEKIATENGLSGVQLLGPQTTITLQKHLLPLEAQDMAVGECVFGDGQYYRLVDKEGNQNDKNSESSSLWKFVVCEPPKEKEEPAVRIPE